MVKIQLKLPDWQRLQVSYSIIFGVYLRQFELDSEKQKKESWAVTQRTFIGKLNYGVKTNKLRPGFIKYESKLSLLQKGRLMNSEKIFRDRVADRSRFCDMDLLEKRTRT